MNHRPDCWALGLHLWDCVIPVPNSKLGLLCVMALSQVHLGRAPCGTWVGKHTYLAFFCLTKLIA